MFNYRLIVAYDGTFYCGWQVQPNGITVQEILQKKIEVILRHPILLAGSGRTDAGVHALGQVAHFPHETEIDLYRFASSLNGLLPKDIRLIEVDQVPVEFHARYSAVGKTYHYHLWLDPVQSPFKRLYSLHVREKIDLTLLKQAAALFLGTHDFTAFANEAHSGSAAHDAVRTIKRLDLISQEGGLRIEIEADGFLYKMVRNIVGTLLDVGRGKMKMEAIPKMFIEKDRRLAGKAAPAHGLFLMHVDYMHTTAEKQ
jgi:tRNA pseudouridine38-40 synthase